MFVRVVCNGKEYDELIKQLKDEKINYHTETTKQTSVYFFDESDKRKDEHWRYIVRFEIDEKLI